MRVTGGEMRGGRIGVPGRMVRPTQDMVREALFSILGARVPGCRFLDLFAGSGSVGLEAWSRAAAFVCWVENSARVVPVLRENVARLCGPAAAGRAEDGAVQAKVVRADAVRFIRGGICGDPFDIIYADPPYDRQGDSSLPRNILQALANNPILAPQGLLVFEQDARESMPAWEGWVEVRRKVYGGTSLRFLVRE